MIKVERGPAPASVAALSAKLVGAGALAMTKGEEEAWRATAFFTDPARFSNNQKHTKEKFAFTVYKDRALVRALEEVFGPKCAYCESRFGHVMPRDVEHFRPKSEVDTGSETLIPGYYWLAAEWDNLLVSCIDCNRSRDQELAGDTGSRKRGKGTQFPLRDETQRFRGPGPGVGIEDAFRLLIDPCRDDPESHLAFDDRAFVHPRPDDQGQPSDQGAASIEVFALQRRRLVDERLITLNQFKFHVEETRRAIEDVVDLTGNAGLSAVRDRRLADISRTRTQIEAMLRPQAAYVGMLRDWIRRTAAAGVHADLAGFGFDLEALI